MALFGKESCTLCDKEVGALGRTKLTDKNPKQYVCRDCIKTKVSPYVDVGFISKEELDRHLQQRERDNEVYEEFFSDFSIIDIKNLTGAHPWSYYRMGEYEYRRHIGSNNVVIWQNPRGKELTYDVLHMDEIQGACVWGEYNDKKSKELKKLPDTTSFTLSVQEEYPDKDIENLYLTIFTRHPFLPTIEVPVIKGGGKEKEMARIRDNAMNVVKVFNRDMEMEDKENYVSKREMKKSTRETGKALFGALRKGGMDEKGKDAVSNLLGNLEKRSNLSTMDERIKELRESNNPRKLF